MINYNNPDKLIDDVLKKVGKKIILGTPLGAGKANHLLNALYKRASNDAAIDLTILTALSLQKPVGKSFLEKKFIEPFSKRVFGNYPDLLYEVNRVKGTIPDNIKVIEFYFPPGKFKNNSLEQRRYLSSNYTHATRDILARGVNVLCQQVCKGEIDKNPVFSLSCNSDLSIDLAKKMREKKEPSVVITQVNQDLPFMYGESIVKQDFFDFVLDDRKYDFKVFASDETVAPCMKALARGDYCSQSIEAGESAVPGLAALIQMSLDPLKRDLLKLDEKSKVLVIGTEGATDPEIYKSLTR